MPSRCSVCPSPHCHPVPDVGPAPAQFLFIGAGPGPTEERTGIPYTGLAGQEWEQTYLSAARLHRPDVHVANCTLCYNGDDKVQETRLMTCARHHLPGVLRRVRPEIVVLMGGATQKIADQRVRLDMQHGRPFWGSLFEGIWEGWIWPSYEPALGMRDTARMTQLIEDFRNLGRWVRGEWTPPSQEGVEKDYRLIEDPAALRTYLDLGAYGTQIAMDTEKHGQKPWSVQFSHTPHTGRMIQATSQLTESLQWWLTDQQIEVILHNAPQDLDTLERMGIRPVKFRDTMQEAYHQCHLPQGLKPLVYRLLGVTMRSWEDVVWPASVNALVEWMADGVGLAGDELQEIVTKQMVMKTCKECGRRGKGSECKHCGSKQMIGIKKLYKPSAVEGVLRHVLTHTVQTQDEDEPYDPWKAIERMRVEGLRGKVPGEWEWERLEERLGPMPILGIGNVPLPEAVEYGCSDADHTGQVARVLEKERGKGNEGGERWRVDREDWD